MILGPPSPQESKEHPEQLPNNPLDFHPPLPPLWPGGTGRISLVFVLLVARKFPVKGKKHSRYSQLPFSLEKRGRGKMDTRLLSWILPEVSPGSLTQSFVLEASPPPWVRNSKQRLPQNIHNYGSFPSLEEKESKPQGLI